MRWLAALLLLLAWVAPAVAGTWGHGQFDNDQSLDTSSNWAKSGTLESIQTALALATSARYLDSDDAVNALVAAEVVAASLGHASKDLPADLAVWFQGQPRDRLHALAPEALAAVERVRSSDGSELYELWADQGVEGWLAQMDDLASRLRIEAAELTGTNPE